MKKIVLFIALTLAALTLHATSYYISPSGNDKNNGTSKDTPFASLATAQNKVKAGDVIYILPGTYQVKESEIMDKTSSNVWDAIFDFTTSGTESSPIIYKGILDAQGNRPVFDLSAINTGKRLTGFYIRAKYLEFSNFEVIGINVPQSSKNTQSENIRINGGSYCRFDNIATHDGMGIGFYLTGRSAHNIISNCDAYNNFDSVNISVNNGGNSDGFGCHVSANCEGNVFEYCRAWQNSDDGFDFINCQSAATARYCIAYRNGFDKDGNKRADGNGFKAGGYGMGKEVKISSVPMHEVSHCLSVGNKANGFYTNHHLGGIKFDHNSAYKNGGYNYSFVNRKGSSLADNIDVDGYGHIVTNNISYKSSKIIKSIDINQCTIQGNSFSYINQTWINETLNDDDFYSLNLDELTAARNTDGSLPTINFMRLKDETRNYGYGAFNDNYARPLLTVHLFGDSTMSTYEDSDKTKGWGQYFDEMFSSEITIKNWAHTGYTVKNGNNLSWKEAREVMNAGDYALIQYAHNDEKSLSAEEYKKYLTTLIKNIKSKKAIPILFTSICRNLMENGKVRGQRGEDPANTGLHEEYSSYMKDIAKELNVVCLDMTAQTQKLLEGIGTDIAAKYIFDGGYTHTSEEGARINARIAATLLYNNNILADYILYNSLVDMPSLIVQLRDLSSTDIEKITIRQPLSSYYYTLDGKRVTQLLRNHIYIYNGKKFINKK